MFVRVDSVVPDGEGDVYDIYMQSPHHNFLANGFVVHNCEALGAVKLDLLGLRHLDTLTVARDLIWDRHRVWVDYTHTSDHEDAVRVGPEHFSEPEIWDQIDKGMTSGIFQLETPELTRLSVEMRPRNEEDVAVLLSIVRPGVKDAKLDKVYLNHRKGAPVTYDHPAMKDITGDTYGVLVYQEQMMQAARTLAGFTADESDDLRKMLGKKKIDQLATWEEKFRNGCLSNPAFRNHFSSDQSASKVVDKIWASISAAGRYSFNKSHAVGYAILSCWEIWTKHHYFEEYIAALLATDADNTNRYLREARRRGIKILPPDINLSDRKFSLGTEYGQPCIRYGLDSIRGVGGAAVNSILFKREGRSFLSLDDFLDRTGCGKTQVEALISIGAFDKLCGDRTQLMTAYHDRRILDKVAPAKRAKMSKQDCVEHVAAWRAKHAGSPSYIKEFTVPDFSDEGAVYRIEQELVGTFVTVDPMMRYLDALENAKALHSVHEMDDIEVGAGFVIGGQVTKVKVHKIQKAGRYKGKEMAFITVEWNGEEFEVTAFPEAWSSAKFLVTEGAPVAFGVVRDDRGAHLVRVERLDLIFPRRNEEK